MIYVYGQTCLILGGTGFLGKNLCRSLLQRHYHVIIYAKQSICLREMATMFPEISFIEDDFIREKDFSKFIDAVDIVFHLISTTNPGNKNMLYDFESNVLPTIRFLDACIGRQIRVIYFSSGGTVYGIPNYLPIDEGHRTEPISAYGIHKLTVEKCLEYYGRTYGLDYIIFRISNPYGMYQNPFANQGVIAVFLSKALLRETIEVWGDGNTVRDYIYVDDVINACLKIVDYTGKVKIFNIGSGKGYSLREIISIIRHKLDTVVEVRYLASRIQDVPTNILDNSLFKRELRWRLHVDLDQGIQKMIDSWDIKTKQFSMEKKI